jgi:hypothetical protein
MVIDMRTRREIQLLNDEPVFVPTSGEEFIKLCKVALTPEDYTDLLCGVMDEEIYEEIEPQIKKLVDTYYSYDR